MSDQLKITVKEEVSFNTIRTLYSILWFINNKAFEEEVLGYLAKYQEEYKFELNHFILMGNHYHMIAKFPLGNRHSFMQSFNKVFNNIAKRHIEDFPGGPLWSKRYSSQSLVRKEDRLHWFFYSALNPISSGLVDNIKDFNSYNGFFDAMNLRTREFKLVDWCKYHNNKRHNKNLKPSDCTKTYELKYSKLEGYENLSDAEYKDFIYKEYKQRSALLVEDMKAKGVKFMGKKKLEKLEPGSTPLESKKSETCPLILTLCKETRAKFMEWYRDISEKFKIASQRYLKGEYGVEFPMGTFKPIVRYQSCCFEF